MQNLMNKRKLTNKKNGYGLKSCVILYLYLSILAYCLLPIAYCYAIGAPAAPRDHAPTSTQYRIVGYSRVLKKFYSVKTVGRIQKAVCHKRMENL